MSKPPEGDKKDNGPDLDEVSFQLILHGGNARAEAYQALKAARAGLFEEAKQHLTKAEEELRLGHAVQTRLLQAGKDGALKTANLLFVHAHGHLMNAMTEKNLIEEMVELYKRMNTDSLHSA